MAVRTQNPKVLESVVSAVTVHMIELETNRLFHPLRSAAHLAPRVLQPSADETLSEHSSVRVVGVLDQDLVQRSGLLQVLVRLPGALARHMAGIELESRDVMT